MSKFSEKIEVTANVLIIIMALLLVGIFAQRYFFGQPSVAAAQPPPARTKPTVGKKINLPDENFSAQPKTVLPALQTSCRFCNESASFYRRLVEETKGRNIKFVAVFPTSVEESTAHLTRLGVSGMEVKQAPISQLDSSGTPTLILTNDKGEVTNFWVGKLTPEKEAEVIKQINF
jgi:thioredoxin-related protein